MHQIWPNSPAWPAGTEQETASRMPTRHNRTASPSLPQYAKKPLLACCIFSMVSVSQAG